MVNQLLKYTFNQNPASDYSVFDDDKIALNNFRSSEPVQKRRTAKSAFTFYYFDKSSNSIFVNPEPSVWSLDGFGFGFELGYGFGFASRDTIPG